MDMRIRIDVTGFAKIQNATVYIDDLMMFVGDNNSGKTLLMELIYGVVDFMSKYKADCTNVKIAKTEYVSYFRFASGLRRWRMKLINICRKICIYLWLMFLMHQYRWRVSKCVLRI